MSYPAGRVCRPAGMLSYLGMHMSPSNVHSCRNRTCIVIIIIIIAVIFILVIIVVIAGLIIRVTIILRLGFDESTPTGSWVRRVFCLGLGSTESSTVGSTRPLPPGLGFVESPV